MPVEVNPALFVICEIPTKLLGVIISNTGEEMTEGKR